MVAETARHSRWEACLATCRGSRRRFPRPPPGMPQLAWLTAWRIRRTRRRYFRCIPSNGLRIQLSGLGGMKAESSASTSTREPEPIWQSAADAAMNEFAPGCFAPIPELRYQIMRSDPASSTSSGVDSRVAPVAPVVAVEAGVPTSGPLPRATDQRLPSASQAGVTKARHGEGTFLSSAHSARCYDVSLTPSDGRGRCYRVKQ
ncbi:hypothetical protein OKW27_007755 [Paraburkholderia sp. 35.1]